LYSLAIEGNTNESRISAIVKSIQKFLEHCFAEHPDDFFDDPTKEKIVINMFLMLEILYEIFDLDKCENYLVDVSWTLKNVGNEIELIFIYRLVAGSRNSAQSTQSSEEIYRLSIKSCSIC
jgi:hypothetical protein